MGYHTRKRTDGRCGCRITQSGVSFSFFIVDSPDSPLACGYAPEPSRFPSLLSNSHSCELDQQRPWAQGVNDEPFDRPCTRSGIQGSICWSGSQVYHDCRFGLWSIHDLRSDQRRYVNPHPSYLYLYSFSHGCTTWSRNSQAEGLIELSLECNADFPMTSCSCLHSLRTRHESFYEHPAPHPTQLKQLVVEMRL